MQLVDLGQVEARVVVVAPQESASATLETRKLAV
jgi:hypothetical protein